MGINLDAALLRFFKSDIGGNRVIASAAEKVETADKCGFFFIYIIRFQLKK